MYVDIILRKSNTQQQIGTKESVKVPAFYMFSPNKEFFITTIVQLTFNSEAKLILSETVSFSAVNFILGCACFISIKLQLNE